MKKIKLMLLGVLVVASLGGAFAFKTYVPNPIYCGTAANSCPILSREYKITTVTPIGDVFCSTQKNGGAAGVCFDVTFND
jgi:hypothetical protein